MSDQPMPKEGEESVTRLLISELLKREEKGLKVYGRSLETFNGRDALQDATEEMVDQYQYLLQARVEYQRMRDALLRLTKHVELNADMVSISDALADAIKEAKQLLE